MPNQDCKLPHGVKKIEVNGYDMAYLESGTGQPLVLVHGSLSDYRVWDLQVKAFSQAFQTIAISLRHCYPEKWDGQGDTFSVQQHADDLSVFIKKLKSGPVHLLAHSRGGDVALVFAAKHPELLQSLILMDPAPFNTMLPDAPEVKAESKKRKGFVEEAIARMQKDDLDGGLELFTDAVSTPGNWQNLSKEAKQIRRDNAWSLKSLVADAQVKFTCADAKKIDVPVLLITGDKSPDLYGMMHEALQPCLKTYQKVTVSDASHGMHKDNPQMFNALVMDFLKV